MRNEIEKHQGMIEDLRIQTHISLHQNQILFSSIEYRLVGEEKDIQNLDDLLTKMANDIKRKKMLQI